MRIQANAGELSHELIKHYASLVDAGVSDNDEGNYNHIIFRKGHAIKYPDDFNFAFNRTWLGVDYYVGLDLMNDFIVPQMYTLGTTELERPFIVMERMDPVIPGKIILSNESKLKKQNRFWEQRRKIEQRGYSTIDASSNFFWSEKHKDIGFWDFEFWTGPRVEKIMRGITQ